MPRRRETAINLDGITVLDAHSESPVDLGTLTGVHVLVLIRHRH